MFRDREPPRQRARPEVAMISMPTTASSNSDYNTTENDNAGANTDTYEETSGDNVYTNIAQYDKLRSTWVGLRLRGYQT